MSDLPAQKLHDLPPVLEWVPSLLQAFASVPHFAHLLAAHFDASALPELGTAESVLVSDPWVSDLQS